MLNIVLRTAQRVWRLTNREAEILKSILSGVISSKELARYLNISESTVGKHLESIARKTAISGRVQLVTVLFRALCRALESVSDPRLESAYPSVAVLDDDVPTSEMLVELLIENGFRAQSIFELGKLTPENIVGTKSEVLLCDYMLPSTDGLEVARSLVPHENKAPSVVLFTGYPEKFSDNSDGSIVSVLYKPLERHHLFREIWIGWMDFRIRNSLQESIVAEKSA